MTFDDDVPDFHQATSTAAAMLQCPEGVERKGAGRRTGEVRRRLQDRLKASRYFLVRGILIDVTATLFFSRDRQRHSRNRPTPNIRAPGAAKRTWRRRTRPRIPVARGPTAHR